MGKIENGRLKKFEGTLSRKRTLFKKYKLGPGQYLAYARMWGANDITLGAYSRKKCSI